jgi:hypothetical protein
MLYLILILCITLSSSNLFYSFGILPNHNKLVLNKNIYKKNVIKIKQSFHFSKNHSDNTTSVFKQLILPLNPLTPITFYDTICLVI